jgi:hypothetical protein
MAVRGIDLAPGFSSGVAPDLTDITDRLSTLENTYVRSTRYESIASTTGTLAIPAGATIVFDDFGGTIDCDVQSISAGRPNGEAAFDTDGNVLASTLDAQGQFVLTGTPAATPIALVYRVRQKFSDYVDTDTNIIGDTSKEFPDWLRVNVTSAQSPYSPMSVKNTIFAVDLTSGSVVINLPEVSEIIEGESCKIYIERTGAGNTLTVNTFSGQTMRGVNSVQMWELRDAITLYAHTYLTDHWDILEWPRTDELLYHAGNTGVSSIRTVQQLLDYQLSAGEISGCAITKVGDGTITVGSGEWKLRTSDSPTADCRVYFVAASGVLTPTNNATSYLVINYNSGTPSWTIETDITAIPCTNKCVQAIFHRRNSLVDYIRLGDYTKDFAARYAKSRAITSWLEYGGGLLVSATGTRNFSVTSGLLYQGTIGFSISAFDTAAADVFDYWYRDGVGGWTVTQSNTQINNTQYDDGDGTLATVSNNRFGVHWVYVIVDTPSRLAVVFGQDNYANLASAQAAAIPAIMPPFAAKFSVGKLVAKIIIQSGGTAFSDIQSPFTQVFASGAPTNHNALSGLQGGTINEYYHLTLAQHTEINSGTRFVNTNQTLLPTDSLILVDTQTGSRELTLPTSSVTPLGKMIRILNYVQTAGNNCYVFPQSGYTIDGFGTTTSNGIRLPYKASVTLIHIGSDIWRIMLTENWPMRVVTANTSNMTAGDELIRLLPMANQIFYLYSTVSAGKRITVHRDKFNGTSYTCTVQDGSGAYINNLASLKLAPGECVTLISGNGEWYVESTTTTLMMQTAPAKATPIDADKFLVQDTASNNRVAVTTFGELKATLKTYFDTLYTPL